MTAVEENFSKIVRSLLLDVDVHLDQLEQIGYLSKEQRAFLDKFLYKSEDALRAANLVRGPRGSDLSVPKSSSNQADSPHLMPSPSRSESGVSNVAPRALPRLRSVTEQLKSEENGLTTFLKRCNARNFSVKVRGTDIGKESPNKGKGSDYILTLEPIAEAISKSDGSSVSTKPGDSKSLEHMNHDTNMMRHGANTLTRDISVESIDYESAVLTGLVAKLNADQIDHTANEAARFEPAKVHGLYTKAVEFRAAAVDVKNIQPAVKHMQVDCGEVHPTDLKQSGSQPSSEDITEITLADAYIANEKEKIRKNNEWAGGSALQSRAAETVEEVETNAWGKPMKPDPTRNKEGAIVGSSAESLGAENKGRAMMEKMGWSKGTGLGKQKDGILEPIAHVVKNTKAGLRSSDEKKRNLRNIPSSSENNPDALSEVKEKPLGRGLPGADKSDCDKAPVTSDWQNSVELTAEQIKSAADWAASKKHAEDMNRAEAEAARGKSKGSFRGIQALYIREAEDPGPEKTIKFRSRIQSTNEYKITTHYPGVVIRAMSAQPSVSSEYLNQKNGFKVSYGNHLEVLRVHQGDEFHVFNFNQKKRGIVKVALLEMMEEPEAPLVDVASWASTPAVAAT